MRNSRCLIALFFVRFFMYIIFISSERKWFALTNNLFFIRLIHWKTSIVFSFENNNEFDIFIDRLLFVTLIWFIDPRITRYYYYEWFIDPRLTRYYEWSAASSSLSWSDMHLFTKHSFIAKTKGFIRSVR